jgi:hypothetical protein
MEISEVIVSEGKLATIENIKLIKQNNNNPPQYLGIFEFFQKLFLYDATIKNGNIKYKEIS